MFGSQLPFQTKPNITMFIMFNCPPSVCLRECFVRERNPFVSICLVVCKRGDLKNISKSSFFYPSPYFHHEQLSKCIEIIKTQEKENERKKETIKKEQRAINTYLLQEQHNTTGRWATQVIAQHCPVIAQLWFMTTLNFLPFFSISALRAAFWK